MAACGKDDTLEIPLTYPIYKIGAEHCSATLITIYYMFVYFNTSKTKLL